MCKQKRCIIGEDDILTTLSSNVLAPFFFFFFETVDLKQEDEMGKGNEEEEKMSGKLEQFRYEGDGYNPCH